MDQTLLAQVGLFIAVLGVVATFVAPRFVTAARIHCVALGLLRIDIDEPTDRVKVQIYHDDILVTDPVFLLSAEITNTGGKDVTRHEFIDPLIVNLGDGTEMLSVDVSAPDGVNVHAEVEGGICQVQWAILKPGETIELKVVGRRPKVPFRQEDIADSVRFIARLRDVKEGPGIRRLIPFGIGLLTSFVLLGLLGSVYLLINATGVESWVYRDPATHVAYTIRQPDPPVRATFTACRVEKGERTEECRRIDETEARRMIAAARREKLTVTLPWGVVVFAVVVAAAYGFALATSVSLMQRMLRMVRLARDPNAFRRVLRGGALPPRRRRR